MNYNGMFKLWCSNQWLLVPGQTPTELVETGAPSSSPRHSPTLATVLGMVFKTCRCQKKKKKESAPSLISLGAEVLESTHCSKGDFLAPPELRCSITLAN